jgi:heme A synthase
VHLIRQLRIVSTLLLAFAVAQAGLGAGYLDGAKPLLIAHATNAFAVLVLALVSTVFGWNLRRSGNPAWTFYLPLTLVVAVGVQMSLGFAGVLGGHVFFGVLVLCTTTAYCSYAWRLRPPAAAQKPVGLPGT